MTKHGSPGACRFRCEGAGSRAPRAAPLLDRARRVPARGGACLGKLVRFSQTAARYRYRYYRYPCNSHETTLEVRSYCSDLLDIRVDIRVDNCAVGATECRSAQIDAGQAQARTHMRAAQRSSFYTAHQGAQDRAMEHSLTPGRHLTRRWRSIRRASLLQLQRP